MSAGQSACCACCGEAVDADALYAEVLTSAPYRDLTRAEFERVRGAAVVGGEGDLRPVFQTLVDQIFYDLRHRVDTQFDEEAAREFVPSFLRRLHPVIACETRCSEGVD